MVLEKIAGFDNSGEILVANIEKYKLAQNKELSLDCNIDDAFLAACSAGKIYPNIEQIYFLAHGFKTTIPEIIAESVDSFVDLDVRLKTLFEVTVGCAFDGNFYCYPVAIDFLEAYFSISSYKELISTSEPQIDYFNMRVELDWAINHTEFGQNLLNQVFYFLGELNNAEKIFVENWLAEKTLIDFVHFDPIEKLMLDDLLENDRFDLFIASAIKHLGNKKVW